MSRSSRSRARIGRGAQEAAAAAGVPLGCGSVDELLEQRLDAVTIAVPPDRQAQVAAAVLAAGVPVLAEKPLAASVDEAEGLAELATSVTNAIDFELAELRTFRTLRETLVDGVYGSVRSVDVSWLRRPRAGRRSVELEGRPGARRRRPGAVRLARPLSARVAARPDRGDRRARAPARGSR